MTPENRYVFGPVPSRRLGRSLGVDLVPLKTCTYDCIYCQLGRTTNLTATRGEWAPVPRVIAEIEDALRRPLGPDVITLSGSGEPTLHVGFGEVIAAVKRMTDTPVAVLTNGSLLWDPDVRAGCLRADLVIPSLDAADPRMFQCVNRPHRDIGFHRVVDGLVEFRRVFRGRIWLEVFLLYGVTGVAPYLRTMLPLIEKINPDKVQLNTAVRPPAEAVVRPVSEGDLDALASLIGSKAEVIAAYPPSGEGHAPPARPEDVLAMLKRRPCTAEDVAAGLGVSAAEARRVLLDLEKRRRIGSETRLGTRFYTARPDVGTAD